MEGSYFKLDDSDSIVYRGHILKRMVATKSFEYSYPKYTTDGNVIGNVEGYIEEGTLGGYVEKIENLSQEYGYKSCWLFDNSIIYGDAYIEDSTYLLGDSIVGGNAKLSQTLLEYKAIVKDDTIVSKSYVSFTSTIKNKAMCNGVVLLHCSNVQDEAILDWDNTNNIIKLTNGSRAYGNCIIRGHSILIQDEARIYGDCILDNVDLDTRIVVKNKVELNTGEYTSGIFE